MNMYSQEYLEFRWFNFWGRLLLWEYKDEGSSEFYIAMYFRTKNHFCPHGTP